MALCNPDYRSAARQLALASVLIAGVLPALGQLHKPLVEAHVLVQPSVVKGSDNSDHVAYELYITNEAKNGPLRLTNLQVFGTGTSVPVASYDGKQLCALASVNCGQGADAVTLPENVRTVLFLWLTFPEGVATVSGVIHSISLENADGRQDTVRGADVAFSPQPAIVIGAPFREGHYWLVTEGPGNSHSHHWRSLQNPSGDVTIAQRFAVDFVGLDSAGHALPVTPDSPRALMNPEWFGYNADVLAVADGIVRDARDGQPDGKPFANRPEPTDVSARGLYGNFVILEIASGIFVHYAHLRPGSIRVQPGQHVHRGDPIGNLGDSGNSAVPHLHFHISNKAVFEGSEGLPFRFDNFTLEGHAGEATVLSPSSAWNAHAVKIKQAMPLDSDVIAFP
jgi:hypothetical protein